MPVTMAAIPQVRMTRCLEARVMLEETKSCLAQEGVPFDKDIPLGVMVETPAAAVLAEQLALEADFFSVGTNDLTQYTLAVDRQNPSLDGFYDPYHPALLRLLREVAESAHKAGIWCGICGELAADLTMTDTFLDMGYDELSVSPTRVLSLRKKVCESEVYPK